MNDGTTKRAPPENRTIEKRMQRTPENMTLESDREKDETCTTKSAEQTLLPALHIATYQLIHAFRCPLFSLAFRALRVLHPPPLSSHPCIASSFSPQPPSHPPSSPPPPPMSRAFGDSRKNVASGAPHRSMHPHAPSERSRVGKGAGGDGMRRRARAPGRQTRPRREGPWTRPPFCP